MLVIVALPSVVSAEIIVTPGQSSASPTIALPPGIAKKFCFTRNLSLGSVGEEVRQLQIKLNADLDTRIAAVGPGSPGNESTYFGPATRAALIKFQEKFKSEILTPNGLALGNGFFGAKAREKLNALMGCGPGTPTPVPAPMPTPAPTPEGISVTVSTDKQTYSSNEDIQIIVALKNTSSQPKQFQFGGCGATYSIPSDNFTYGQVCALYLMNVTLQPNETKSWTFTHKSSDKALAAGSHTIRGTVTNYGSADTVIMVQDLAIVPQLKVVSPNGNEVWAKGSQHPLSWSVALPKGYENKFATLKLDLSFEPYHQPCTNQPCPMYASIKPFTIAQNVSAISNFLWNTAQNTENRFVPAGQYVLKVCPAGMSEGCDTSDAGFVIVDNS